VITLLEFSPADYWSDPEDLPSDAESIDDPNSSRITLTRTGYSKDLFKRYIMTSIVSYCHP
jgi:hypothetical protein